MRHVRPEALPRVPREVVAMTLPDKLLGPEGYDPMWDDVRKVGDTALYFDRQGQPMTLRQWVTGIETDEYRFLKRTRVGESMIVTAWNGVNDGWPDPEAQIFGTIEIRGQGENVTYHDEETDSTEAAALATHDRRVEELRKELNP